MSRTVMPCAELVFEAVDRVWPLATSCVKLPRGRKVRQPSSVGSFAADAVAAVACCPRSRRIAVLVAEMFAQFGASRALDQRLLQLLKRKRSSAALLIGA
jgi:hypothetical protein